MRPRAPNANPVAGYDGLNLFVSRNAHGTEQHTARLPIIMDPGLLASVALRARGRPTSNKVKVSQ